MVWLQKSIWRSMPVGMTVGVNVVGHSDERWRGCSLALGANGPGDCCVGSEHRPRQDPASSSLKTRAVQTVMATVVSPSGAGTQRPPGICGNMSEPPRGPNCYIESRE